MHRRQSKHHAALLCSAAVAALGVFAGSAHAAASEAAQFNIQPQALKQALLQFSQQSGHDVLVGSELARTRMSPGFSASAADPDTALKRVLGGTGLSYRRDGDIFVIIMSDNAGPPRKPAPAQQFAPAETVSGSAIDGLVVTAQKRREAIQDVPIAISAFSADTLQAQKIEGGFDLLKAIPNVTFSKNNFSGYNFAIRGIGTKGISVATDPGVAVEFNDTALIRNRLFEQEYFDVERVEVLRGPQGTLHGRNATAGVINVISNTADLDAFDGQLKGEVGNYHTKRLSGFINAPLIEDVLAARFAGSLTSREGYDYNATTHNPVNGRDLWSGRLSIAFAPTDRIRADFIWERFNEDDDRSRTGKQLCHRDPGPINVGSQMGLSEYANGLLSQGCKAGSLYDTGAFGTPNGLSIPFVQVGADPNGGAIGYIRDENNLVVAVAPILALDAYGNARQSEDLRVINSIRDPRYNAETDVFELNIDFDLTDHLSITSQTAYVDDSVYSFQDYNRFNTVPIFRDTSNLYENIFGTTPSRLRNLLRGGMFCDPQIGCSDSIAGFDISRAKSEQFSQEFRISSDFDGAWNFSAGANYTRYKTLEDYFVLFNLITLLAQTPGPLYVFNNSTNWNTCMPHPPFEPGGRPGNGDPSLPDVATDSPGAGCVYIDPNPLENINGEGHNYFRSKNPYTLKSYAAFGEVYWQMSEALKFTLGLRYTDDNKTFTPVPTQILLTSGLFGGGTVDRGYPALPDIKQQWGEFSGRIGFDWKPDVSFTDETLLYAFYSRGYKGGGANPPGIGYSKEPLEPGLPAALIPSSYPATFEPEFNNAFEIGTKNTLLGGALVLNAGVFYYDYKNYQVSQIKERTAVNENFDATVWGLEFESIFAPNENLRLNATLGYQDTEIADGETSLDLMDRTAGNPDWMVIKPWVQLSSNCIAPTAVVEARIAQNGGAGTPSDYVNITPFCPGFWLGDIIQSNRPWLDDPAVHGGAGFYKELGGNELPNAPHFTVSFGAEYGWDLLGGEWRATMRGDAYWQSQSWARVYNFDPYDKLHGWYNANASFWIEKPSEDLKIEFYVKNLLDDTPITDAFLNSDDTALTTNVFILDPRLIGLQITKGF